MFLMLCHVFFFIKACFNFLVNYNALCSYKKIRCDKSSYKRNRMYGLLLSKTVFSKKKSFSSSRADELKQFVTNAQQLNQTKTRNRRFLFSYKNIEIDGSLPMFLVFQVVLPWKNISQICSAFLLAVEPYHVLSIF